MFSQDREIVEKLLEENKAFKERYQRHRELNTKVDKVGTGDLPLTDDAAHDLKKEKLLLKDEMAEIIMRYKQQSG